MAKTVSLPPVRVEPEMRDALAKIAEETGASMYELTRTAVAEFIYRHQLVKRAEQAVQVLREQAPA